MPVSLPSSYGVIVLKNAKTLAYVSSCIPHDMARLGAIPSYVNQDEHLYACSVGMNPMDAESAVKELEGLGMGQGEDFVVTTSTGGVLGTLPVWLRPIPESAVEPGGPATLFALRRTEIDRSTHTPDGGVPQEYLTAVAMLRGARQVATLTGAGLSKASGILTYRDADSLRTKDGSLRFGSTDAGRGGPVDLRDFWGVRQSEIENAQPNAAHFALARLGRLLPAVDHVTQNVDGLLAMAGCERVYELHGSMRRYRCDSCGRGPFPPALTCPGCGALARPDAVMFGQALPAQELAEAEIALKRCDVCVVIGTEGDVQPAAGLVAKAVNRGARLVIVNPRSGALDSVAAVVIREIAEVALPTIVRMIEQASRHHVRS